MAAPMVVLIALQDAIRTVAAEGRDTERVGPFLATFDPHTALIYANYAIPDPGATPAPGDVQALAAAYRRRDRVPRVEMMPAVAPAAADALLAGGFAVEARMPVMTCTAHTLAGEPPVDGVVLERPATAEDLRGLLAAQAAAFGGPAPNDDAVARVAADDDGMLRVLARETVSGRVVGGGVATRPVQGIFEVGGIGVLEAYRRRGIAGAMTARLARERFEQGARTAFLTPGDTGAGRVYTRAGFTDAAEMLHLSMP